MLSFPKRMSRRVALDWAGKQREWVERQLAKVEPSQPLAPGTRIAVEGADYALHWDPALPRSPRLADGQLQCGGPREGFSRRIEQYLRGLARERLSEATAATARRAGVAVRSVSIGDAGSRWGSCSSSGAIRYNWRIVMAPPHLLQWLVAHEVAHRVHMNHGAQFRALEAELYGGDVAAARAELRALGPRLKRVGLNL